MTRKLKLYTGKCQHNTKEGNNDEIEAQIDWWSDKKKHGRCKFYLINNFIILNYIENLYIQS